MSNNQPNGYSITTTEGYLNHAETGRVVNLTDGDAIIVHKPPTLFGQSAHYVIDDSGEQHRLVVGVVEANTDNGGAAWLRDVTDGDVSMTDVHTPYSELTLGDRNPRKLVDRLTISDSRNECPHCDRGTSRFLHKFADGNIITEIRLCYDSDDDAGTDHIYGHEVQMKPSTKTDPHEVTLYTRNGESRTACISGMFERHDTGDWNGLATIGQGDDTPKGVWTATEVAEWVNAKMHTDGEAQRFGCVEIGGSRHKHEHGRKDRPFALTWWDNSNWNWNARVQFVPVSNTRELDTLSFGPVPTDN